MLDEVGLVRWGERIGRTVEAPAFFALRGELGAGKSVLARAIARGAGVTGPMPSPTFNLVYRYPARNGVTFAHLDLFRIETIDEVWELGWSELGAGREIVALEWPQRAESLLPPDRWEIRLEFTARSDMRNVTFEPVGSPPRIPPPDVG
jgi:tRNA threonylcarbamoyladenosine biosynthesis protein TsaE